MVCECFGVPGYWGCKSTRGSLLAYSNSDSIAVWGFLASEDITDQDPYFGKIWALSSIHTYAYVAHMIP